MIQQVTRVALPRAGILYILPLHVHDDLNTGGVNIRECTMTALPLALAKRMWRCLQARHRRWRW